MGQETAAPRDFGPAYDGFGSDCRGGMSALSPLSPRLRTLVGAVGTAEKCQ
jgi:hypothetical protein